MENKIIRDKILRLLIQDSVRAMLVKYNFSGNSITTFLETSAQLSNELVQEINIIYDQYPSTDTED